MKAAIDYLERVQLKDGSWFGRWGVNYIYGTWSALAGLNAAGVDPKHPLMRKAAEWLIAIQNEDGGWGESCDSYSLDYAGYQPAPSTASQTAWALLGLMEADDGLWNQLHYTGGGFPRVFYLRYHGYPKFFPLWALARYRNLKASNTRRVAHGL
jgi:squalene-hopene/tetraprenyl-beta-curcumene cyclase